ncbi:hypothetical protein [Aphanizomenon flos-aquae]|jgi:hypothetical protein|uniref:Uncharacterized protein n=1 Tax=Aphanizomenon flos-aquae FACHB-1040 TaxID=2692887 RepID=A0ABR8C202_APHFL|nr:hypothetical protein [Aphanizomenon flos-aquae]MBD2281158.1 hypothetical protein [Aphanizomenon flos-aquae FACHB-1040]
MSTINIKSENERSSSFQENSKRDNYEFLYKTKEQINQYSYKIFAFEKERHNKLQKLVELVAKIRNYLSLPDDWDGYQGIAPKSKTIEETISVVKRLHDYHISLPKPMVSGTGIVGLFWEKDNIYIEICFEGDGTFWYYGKDGNLEIGEESVSLKQEAEFPRNLINLIAKI